MRGREERRVREERKENEERIKEREKEREREREREREKCAWHHLSSCLVPKGRLEKGLDSNKKAMKDYMAVKSKKTSLNKQ